MANLDWTPSFRLNESYEGSTTRVFLDYPAAKNSLRYDHDAKVAHIIEDVGTLDGLDGATHGIHPDA